MADHNDQSTPNSPPPPDALINSSDSIAYWNSTPSTVSGMLGGFPQVSRIDITGSRTFLVKLLRISNPCPSPAPGKKLSHVADTGAGIGRITRNLLAPLATHVDVVEPVQKFTDQLRHDAPELFPSSTPPTHSSNSIPPTTTTTTTTAQIINHPLETWTPDRTPPYDLIWNQWCLGHLTDTQLTAYLRRLAPALSPNGWIVVKENVLGDGSRRFFAAAPSTSTRSASAAQGGRGGASHQQQQEEGPSEAAAAAGDEPKPEPALKGDEEEEEEEEEEEDKEEHDLYDSVDSSVTRSAGKFEWIFGRAGLRVVRTEVQRGFGRGLGLYPVRMWGLQPVGAHDKGDTDGGEDAE